MFLHSVTKVSVSRSFKEYENIKLIHSLLQFKILCTEQCITNCGMKWTGNCGGLRADNVSKYVLWVLLCVWVIHNILNYKTHLNNMFSLWTSQRTAASIRRTSLLIHFTGIISAYYSKLYKRDKWIVGTNADVCYVKVDVEWNIYIMF
jgi:hypothetical protein